MAGRSRRSVELLPEMAQRMRGGVGAAAPKCRANSPQHATHWPSEGSANWSQQPIERRALARLREPPPDRRQPPARRPA